MHQSRKRIVIFSSGISGLASAYFFIRKQDVMLFDAAAHVGGHTSTVDVTLQGRRPGGAIEAR